MSHKAKVDPAVQQQQQASLAAVRQPSAGEQYLTNDATSTLDYIKAGDYTKRPKNLFFNFADPAQRDQNRRLMMNAGGQGVFALGSPSPNLLATQKQNLDDEWARDSAGQYEQDISNAQTQARGALGDVAGLANQRNLGALGATSGMWGQSLQADAMRKPWWQILIEGAQRGAQAAAMGAGG